MTWRRKEHTWLMKWPKQNSASYTRYSTHFASFSSAHFPPAYTRSKCDNTPDHDVNKWKHFPRNWSFVRGIHWSPVNSPHKSQWRGALMFSLICVWINDWVNNRKAGDLRCYRARYDVVVMYFDGLVQDCSNGITLTMELLQSCSKPSIFIFAVFICIATFPRLQNADKFNHTYNDDQVAFACCRWYSENIFFALIRR